MSDFDEFVGALTERLAEEIRDSLFGDDVVNVRAGCYYSSAYKKKMS